MDLLEDDKLDIFNNKKDWRIYSEDTFSLPQYISPNASVKNSMINQGCKIEGKVCNSVLFNNVIVEKGAIVEDSVILPNSVIKANAHIKKVIVGNDTVVQEDSEINLDGNEAILVMD